MAAPGAIAGQLTGQGADPVRLDRVAVFRLTEPEPGRPTAQTWTFRGRPPTYASASTSTRCSGSSSPATTTSVATGRTAPRYYPLSRPVTVEAAADGEYVLIEVPVPAGCSYGPKIFRESRYEDHREYLRDRVAIFCGFLPKGRHTFHIPLEARFTGHYTLNPAKAELMYVPVINGATKLKKVKVQ